ncbi:UNVERIFIED_CONTAM: hypothetical protein FKN15_071369 [Acipenser sinensis]
MNKRCPPKRVSSAACFFTHCELTLQPPQSYRVRGQCSSGQLTVASIWKTRNLFKVVGGFGMDNPAVEDEEGFKKNNVRT